MKIEKEVMCIGSVLNEVIHDVFFVNEDPNEISGIASGFNKLDALTSGWQESHLIVIGGYHFDTNNCFMLSMALNMAVKNNTSLAIFSLRFPNKLLVRRMLSNLGELSGEKILRGRLQNEDWQKLDDSETKLYKAPIYLYDAPNPTIAEIADKAHSLVQTENIKVLFIDYLQLIGTNNGHNEKTEQENNQIVQSLRILARELDIPIIVLMLLNEPTNTQSLHYGARPELNDLPELYNIRQLVNVICILYIPENFQIIEDEHGNSTIGKAELIVAQNYLEIGIVPLQTHLQYSQFLSDEYSTETDANKPF